MEKTEKITGIGRNIITILVGLITLIPVFKSSIAIIKEGLTSQLPAFWILITGIGGLVLGWLWNRNRKSGGRISRETKNKLSATESSIIFNYSTPEPQKYGWTVKADNLNQTPLFKLLDDEKKGIYLKVESLGWYRMDYLFEPYQYTFKEVSFIAKLEKSSLLYVNCVVYNENTGKKIERFWLKIDYSGNYKPPQKVSDTEWQVSAPMTRLENGWSKVTINAKKEFAKINDMKDWKVERLRAVRLRESISISKIELK